MTLIPTAPDKMEEAQKLYMMNELLPKLKEYMKLTGYEMAPYVNLRREIPDSGILAFNDSPGIRPDLRHCLAASGLRPKHTCLNRSPTG